MDAIGWTSQKKKERRSYNWLMSWDTWPKSWAGIESHTFLRDN